MEEEKKPETSLEAKLDWELITSTMTTTIETKERWNGRKLDLIVVNSRNWIGKNVERRGGNKDYVVLLRDGVLYGSDN